MDLVFARDVQEAIFGYFANLGLPPPPSDEIELRDAGLTSLQVVDLIFHLESIYAVEIPDSDITPENFRSVSTIARKLDELKRADLERG